jgi:CIC family chloride channel protein
VSIFELFTHQDGLYLPSMEELREETDLHFEDALLPINSPILNGSETISETKKTLQQNPEIAATPVVLILCSQGRWYAARQEELQKILNEVPSDDAPGARATLEERIGPERTPLIFPDQPLVNALPYFQRWPILPVSNRAMRGAIEGVLTLDDVLKRYQRK